MKIEGGAGDLPDWVGIIMIMPDGERKAWQVGGPDVRQRPSVRARFQHLETEPDPRNGMPRPKPGGLVRLDITINGYARYWDGHSPPATAELEAPRREIEQ